MKKGERFSVTLDEYTAKNIHRFTDLNVHFPREVPRCIGIIRIHGSLNADAAAEQMKQKLTEFGLDINQHIVANTTDAASVMVAMGDLLPTIHQLCMAHGIHLAVVSVLYKVRAELFILLLASTTTKYCRRGQGI